MQCTSYVPLMCRARDLNVGSNVFSLHPFDSNANFGDERGHNTAMLPYYMNQYIANDKEMMKQIIQNHEATFRHQVQELHRLYQRQRELMDEMRVREIFANHLLSQTSESIQSSHSQFGFFQRSSHDQSCLLGDNIQMPLKFVAGQYHESAMLQPNSFIRTDVYNDIKFLSSSRKGNGNRIVGLELTAHVYHDDQVKQFEGNLSEATEYLPNYRPASDSEIGSVKTGDSSSFNLNNRKNSCFIDLNEPAQLESLPSSSSSGPSEACPIETMNSSVAIDLNALPANCFSEKEITPENFRSLSKETTLVLDRSSACHRAVKDEQCIEHNPIVQETNGKFVKTAFEIDLNTGILDEHSPPLSSSVLQISSSEDTELVGPMSPENEECSPPRGKSNDIQVETPLLSDQGEGEASMEVDTVAAQTLVTISFQVQEYNSRNPLCWFAEIISFIGDDLEGEIMKLETDAADIDQGEINAPRLCRLQKDKERGFLSGRAVNGRTRGAKRYKDFQIEGFMETGLLRRKACKKLRKHSKLSSSDVVKKSMSSILKQPVTRSKQVVLQSWGKMRKRQGGRRCRTRASEFLLIS